MFREKCRMSKYRFASETKIFQKKHLLSIKFYSTGNRIKGKKNSCICLEQILVKISGSHATLKGGKLSSNIYCTWQGPNELRVKRRKFCHGLLHFVYHFSDKKAMAKIWPHRFGCNEECHGYVGSCFCICQWHPHEQPRVQ